MMGWGWGGGWGWSLWGVLMTLAMWAIPLGLIFLGIWAVAPRFRGGAAEGQRSSALEIAEQRYARGEISREEFQQIKEDLRREQPRPPILRRRMGRPCRAGEGGPVLFHVQATCGTAAVHPLAGSRFRPARWAALVHERSLQPGWRVWPFGPSDRPPARRRRGRGDPAGAPASANLLSYPPEQPPTMWVMLRVLRRVLRAAPAEVRNQHLTAVSLSTEQLEADTHAVAMATGRVVRAAFRAAGRSAGVVAHALATSCAAAWRGALRLLRPPEGSAPPRCPTAQPPRANSDVAGPQAEQVRGSEVGVARCHQQPAGNSSSTFGLQRVVLVGDRGMITRARIGKTCARFRS